MAAKLIDLSFTLNGRKVKVQIAPDTMLFALLREQGCASVRCACETTNCGLCTVWLDGDPVLSCSVPAVRVEGRSITTLEDLSWKTALGIGCFQVLSLVPGTSRSGSTIIGGLLLGCTRSVASKFTFFLAIPIMFGWGVVKAAKFMMEGLVMTQTEIMVLAVGIISAFIMSVVAIRFLMGYIKKHDFKVFGWYRIVLGIVVLLYFGLIAK